MAKVWDAASGKELLTLEGYGGDVLSVAWGPDGNRLATGSVDKTAKVWDAAVYPSAGPRGASGSYARMNSLTAK